MLVLVFFSLIRKEQPTKLYCSCQSRNTDCGITDILRKQKTEFQGPRDTFSALVVLTLRAVMMHDADVLGILLPQHAIGYTLCGI